MSVGSLRSIFDSAAQQAWRERLLRAQPRLRWLECEYVGAREREGLAQDAAVGAGGGAHKRPRNDALADGVADR